MQGSQEARVGFALPPPPPPFKGSEHSEDFRVPGVFLLLFFFGGGGGGGGGGGRGERGKHSEDPSLGKFPICGEVEVFGLPTRRSSG